MSEAQPSTAVEADLKKIVKVGRGKRDLILGMALVVVAILIGAVWFGFRGSHVSQGAAALTAPVPPAAPQTTPRPTPP
jgi:hypothetical protein